MTNTSDNLRSALDSLVQQAGDQTERHQQLNAPFEDDILFFRIRTSMPKYVSL
jgi:hypothetical protein